MTARWLAFVRGQHRPARAEAEQAEEAEKKVREELITPLRQMRTDDWIRSAVEQRILGTNHPLPPPGEAAGR